MLSSRSDPPLPLHRLRVSGDLAELRQDQLKMSEADAAEVIQRVSRTSLTPAQVRVLVRRTEGWPAGILMAALSLRGHANVDEFVQTFSGDDRNVADYLADEVLARQPAEIREFLLDTSVLRRMSGPLCDAVTDRTRQPTDPRAPGAIRPLRRPPRRSADIGSATTRSCATSSGYELHAARTAPASVSGCERAAAWHIEQNDLEIAADYLVVAELWDDLVEFLQAHGRSLLERGTDRRGERLARECRRRVHRGRAATCN